jgi:hypothetical protein
MVAIESFSKDFRIDSGMKAKILNKKETENERIDVAENENGKVSGLVSEWANIFKFARDRL